ncbi:MAG: hypothetical protein AB8B85_08745 [Paracoccaceae bacterium]
MKNVLTAGLIAAAALSTTAALAESSAAEQRAKLNSLWGKSATPAVSAQVSSTRDTTTGDALEGIFFAQPKDRTANDVLRNLRSSQPKPAGR